MKKEKKNSEYISDFLDFLRDAQESYHIAMETEEEAGKETQDILHRLELEDDGYHDMAKMAKTMKTVRKKRREAKDVRTETEPLIMWIGENGKIIHGLEKLLGEIRKAERANTNRHYICRTDVLNGVLKDE